VVLSIWFIVSVIIILKQINAAKKTKTVENGVMKDCRQEGIRAMTIDENLTDSVELRTKTTLKDGDSGCSTSKLDTIASPERPTESGTTRKYFYVQVFRFQERGLTKLKWQYYFNYL